MPSARPLANPSPAYDAVRSAVIAHRYDDLPPLLAATTPDDGAYLMVLLEDDRTLQKDPYLDQVLDRVSPAVMNHPIGPSPLNPHADTVPLWYQVYRRLPYGSLARPSDEPSLETLLGRLVAHGADLALVAGHPDLATPLGPRARTLADRIAQVGVVPIAPAPSLPVEPSRPRPWRTW